MKILVLNCGSSSLKFQLIDMKTGTPTARGVIEKIGTSSAILTFRPHKMKEVRERSEIRNYKGALELMISILTDKTRGVIGDVSEIKAVGHRVVHGGEQFSSSVYITGDVINNIRDCSVFAPLHNPANLLGIETCAALIKGVDQVAVFDTAYHHQIPKYAYLYAIPYTFYERFKIRRYGFHGTSHWYVSRKAAQVLGKDYGSVRVISCHLGNGGSIAAIRDGHSIDTTMGFTPLEGLIMGTRSGDLDPAVIPYIMQKENLNPKEMDDILNKASGLKGITKITSDMREILEEVGNNSEQHKLALEMYCYRIKKYIGAYYAALGGADALVFTAGVGENNPVIRQMVCEGLECIGIVLDRERNEKNEGIISSGQVKVMVIPTNEEMAIAQETYSVISEKRRMEAEEIEADRSRREMELLTEADKARIAIMWSKNIRLSVEELFTMIKAEMNIGISLETLKVLMQAMNLQTGERGDMS